MLKEACELHGYNSVIEQDMQRDRKRQKRDGDLARFQELGRLKARISRRQLKLYHDFIERDEG